MEREEFAGFYATSCQRLVGQLYAMMGDQAEAQDVVQEAFVRPGRAAARSTGTERRRALVLYHLCDLTSISRSAPCRRRAWPARASPASA